LIFLRFSTPFTRIGKGTLLLKFQFCGQTPEMIRSLQIYPYFAAEPLERLEGLQLGPWGVGRRQSGEIPARVRRSPTGEGRGVA
jgi:hypothetical protein